MWCSSCKADVAAEVVVDNRRVCCATCGADIPAPAVRSGVVQTREARNLLERWASDRKEQATSAAESTVEPSAAAGRSPPSRQREAERAGQGSQTARSPNRLDEPEPLAGPFSPETRRAEAFRQKTESHRGSTRSAAPRPAARPEPSRFDPHHALAQAPPHFDIQSSLIESHRRTTNWSAVFGQLLAYVGVALITVGSTFIVWSYFGGPAAYAPTGWLTATAGQMLFFLGIVTFVSGGLERTNDELTSRIERLGERIIRIEHIAREQALRGPILPAESYGSPGGSSGAAQPADHLSQRQTEL